MSRGVGNPPRGLAEGLAVAPTLGRPVDGDGSGSDGSGNDGNGIGSGIVGVGVGRGVGLGLGLGVGTGVGVGVGVTAGPVTTTIGGTPRSAPAPPQFWSR